VSKCHIVLMKRTYFQLCWVSLLAVHRSEVLLVWPVEQSINYDID